MNITLPRAVIEQALEALEQWNTPLYKRGHIITALRTALGQQYMTNAVGELEPVTVVQTGVGVWKLEPVAWMLKSGHGTGFTDKLTDELKALTWKGKPMWTPLYTAPPQRKPLSDEELDSIIENWWRDDLKMKYEELARAIEAAHGIKEEA